MKRFLCAIVLTCACCFNVHAQLKVDFGSFAFGATANYGVSHDYKNAGVGLVVQKFWGEQFRVNVYGNYFFEHNNARMIEFGGDFNYVFPLTKKMGIYPVLGIGYSIVKLKGVNEAPPGVSLPEDYGDDSDGAIHFDFGVGYEYYFTPTVKGLAEVKYRYAKDYGRTLFSLGIAYVW
jgi:hypothetical protein